MGARGPLPRKRTTGQAATGTGKRRLRRLPDDVDAIFRRLVRDIENLNAGDAALIEDMARWLAIAKRAYADLHVGGKMALTVTDTAHGNKEESRKNPLLIVLRTASEQLRANAQQLGASPMARARLPEREQEQLSIADILFADVNADHDGL
jgi:phage terminase small subunit